MDSFLLLTRERDGGIGNLGEHFRETEFLSARADRIGKVFEEHRKLRRFDRRRDTLADDIVEVDAQRVVSSTSQPGQVAQLHHFE